MTRSFPGPDRNGASCRRHLELRDETRIGEDVWARAQEDSLRGLFLRELRTKFDVASSNDERAKISLAARFGLAALDGRDL